MKIIKPSATLMEHNIPPYEFIEKVGRTCYKSEEYIKEGSAEKFVANLVRSEHMAMLEHEHIYIVTSPQFMKDFLGDMDEQNEQLEYFNITHDRGINIISGSFRSFYDLFKNYYPSLPVEYMKKVLINKYPVVFGSFKEDSLFNFERYYGNGCSILSREVFIDRFCYLPRIMSKHLIHTFLFVCDRGVTHEFVRHRPASYAQESTRYCNYSKDKFGNEITVIEPCFWGLGGTIYFHKEWFDQCFSAEKSYFKLLEMGATPQEARTVLPHSLKTEIIVTATESEWQHIVNLRYLGTTGAPHPQIKEVMGLAIDDLMNATDGRVNILEKF